MRSTNVERPAAAGSSRSARSVLIAYVACVLVAKLSDANPHPDEWHIPFVLVCFILPVWYLSGRWREPWLRAPWAMVALQGVVTVVPLLVFGSHWVGGIDGLLAALVLMVFRSRVRWLVFAALAILELVGWGLVGYPYDPAPNAAIWLMVAFLNLGLGLYGLTLATTVLERLESTTEVLADAAVDSQRLATAAGLQTSILGRLDEVRRHADAALTAAPDVASTELAQMGRAARDAAQSARRIASTLPGAASPVPDEAATSPAVAFRIVVAIVVLFCIQYLDNTLVLGAHDLATWGLNLVSVAIALAAAAIQLRHSTSKGRKPGHWPWTFGALAAMSFVFYPVYGVSGLLLLTFVAGSALLLVDRPVRWVVFAAAIATVPVLTVVKPLDPLTVLFQVQWSIYALTTLAAASLLIYELGRFARAAAQLADARQRLAEAAATRELVRIARDTHDTLGLALSTIALKSDLAQALLADDPARAHREIVQAMHLARNVAADAESIVTGTLHLDVDTELTTAREALKAAGTTVTINRTIDDIPPSLETQLAAVLREAIANVLRHSDARRCSVSIVDDDDDIVVTVINDGLRDDAAGSRGGHGLQNIRSRVQALGGSVLSSVEGGRFVLTARLPRTAASVTAAVP